MGNLWSFVTDNLWSSVTGNKEEERRILKEVLKTNRTFTIATYDAIRSERMGDVLFSPPHLQHALMSLFAGATNAGAEELRVAFQVPADRRVWQRAYAGLRHYLRTIKDTTMATGVRVIVPDRVRLMKDYYVTSHKYFSVGIKPMNLMRSHQDLRISINNWISKETKDFVTQLIPVGSVNATIQMLMISAVYFKATLASPFYLIDTTNDLFYASGTNEVRAVKLMHQTNMFLYGEFENLQCQAVEMPFKNPNLSCLVLLPYTGDGILFLEDKLQSIDFIALLENMTKAKVKVSMPSFRLQEKYDMCDHLERMGLASLANYHECPLRKVSQCEPAMALTQFNHEFHFELSEETDVPSERVKLPDDESKTYAFRADHPFLFIILDKWLNTILAFGRINCYNRYTTPIFHHLVVNQRSRQLRQYLEHQAALKAARRDARQHLRDERIAVRFNLQSEVINPALTQRV